MKKIIGLLAVTVLIATLTMHSKHVSATASLPRPVVMDNTLKTPSGGLLRGTNESYGDNWPDLTAEAEDTNYWQRAQEFGLNVMRITNRDAEAYNINHSTNPPQPPLPVWSISDNLTELDKLVNIAKNLGMYVIITPNSNKGTFNKQYLEDFWSQAAPRYKDDTNVIYEMQNEPVQWSANDYTTQDINDLADVYAIMRGGAPDTPILSLCIAVASDDMRPLVQKYTTATGINWSNGKDLVSFHPYGTTTDTYIDELKAAYPTMNTENGNPRRDSVQTIPPYKYHTEMLEKKGISWINFWMTRTDDQFARWTYNLVDDAKATGYYWQAPDNVITDDLNDFSMTDSSSAVAFDSANSSYFNGDTSRIKRSGSNAGSIVYKIGGNLNGIGSMKVTDYYNDTTYGVKFYVSEDGANWTQVDRDNTTPVATAGGWYETDLTFTNAIPVNTNYIKVELVAGVNNEIGAIQFNSWNTNHYGGVDELANWNLIHSKSSNMVQAAAGDVKGSFDSDPDRVMKNSNAVGYITYEAHSDIYDGFYLTTFIKSGSTGVTFFTSPDGSTWTSLSDTNMTTKVVDMDGTWSRKDYTLDYTANPLPSGTQYIKVEIQTTSDYSNTEIGSFTWWTKYDFSGGPSPTPTPTPTPSPTPTPTTLINDNFNSETTGGAPAGYTLDQAGGSVTVEEVPSATDKSMKIYDNNSTQTVNASQSFTPQSGTLTWQFDVMPEQTDKSSYYRLTDNGTIRLHLSFTGSDTIRYWHDSSSTYSDIGSYTAGTWYNVKIVANVSTDKYDVYINGVQKVSQANFESAAASLDGILVETGETAVGTMYVDNINVVAN